MKVVLIGLPGAGKGTQGKRLAKFYDLVWLSSGDIFRQEINAKSPVSLRMQALVAQGRLVSDDIVNEIMLNKLKGLDHFILDGYPRNLYQAQSLVEFLSSQNTSLDYVIDMVITEKEVITRLENRVYCKMCGRVYNKNQLDKDKNCRICYVSVSFRHDDHEDTVRERLKVHNTNIVSVLQYFQTLGLLRKVDSSGNIDKVFNNMKQVLGN